MRDTQKNLYKKLLGRRGENRAVKLLKKKGYKIAERNYRSRSGEADIIAYDGETLVFTEVKTRTSGAYGTPAEAVGYVRQKRYLAIAKEYIYLKGLEHLNVRFDVIEVTLGGINHITDAFWG